MITRHQNEAEHNPTISAIGTTRSGPSAMPAIVPEIYSILLVGLVSALRGMIKSRTVYDI